MFSEQLKKIMQARGMTAAELATLSGVSNASISQYLAGKNVPRKDKLEKLADLLGVVPEILLYGERTTGAVQEETTAPVIVENNIPVEVAARLMGVSPQFIRIGLQKKILPFGYAVKFERSYRYFISARKFTAHTGIEVPRKGGAMDG